ncbi:MAG: vitamin B12-dependent ribonucleotide reductase [Myxococcales bacterium]|nr:MAG: vitamin B12-dependent ribonucleotide reductase [Myxococcales bacterium]
MAPNQTPETATPKTASAAVGVPAGDSATAAFSELYDPPKAKVQAAPAPSPAPSEEELIERLPGGNYRIQAEKLHHAGPGLAIPRYFSREGVHPYEEVTWEKRSAAITNDKGQTIFEQNDIEMPDFWSQLATNVVVSKYFRGKLGEPTREKSLRDLIDRVSITLADWGLKQGVFASKKDRDVFENELTYLLLHQMGAFNSPVWFNVGLEPHPQCSACFINSVQDTMESILTLAKTEGMLFKYGSGTGTNLSTLRSSKEHLSTGGIASGPVSFMKGYDAFAGVIKSGGKTRRAAKMVILNADHPDIVEFIDCKVKEERKAWALIEQGYDSSFDGEAYGSVFFQNSNNSVRVADEFMKAAEADEKWETKAITDRRTIDTYQARELLRKIAEGAHVCGDPGMQFDSEINRWNPVLDTKRINASNPCSEYMFVDDSACNLASLNLLSFRTKDGEFDVEAFQKAVDIFITAQEIIVDNASYPRQQISWNSHLYRPLGLGYTNLGALLMARGLPYDSDEGRTYAAAITSLMTGRAYHGSARFAKAFGPFREYAPNRGSFLRVIGQHRAAARKLNKAQLPKPLYQASADAWDEAYAWGEKHGFRNGQVTVLAPTGTISFMMDADTTGIEPDLALVKYKKLVGGGMFKIVNNAVPESLRRLGYSAEEIRQIEKYIEENETIEGAPAVKLEHLPVFDCALQPTKGVRYIDYMGHVKMMAACQPFLSGAISKTVNVPEDTTVEEIMNTYLAAWKLGLKAVAIYRNNSKRTQPLNTSKGKKKTAAGKIAAAPEPAAEPTVEAALAETISEAERAKTARRKLPNERMSITHKMVVAGHEGYLTVGMYEDGKPGEIFIVMSKEGSTISGLLDGFATMTSLALQYGVPLADLVEKFSHMRFEPSGFTGNPEIPFAKSIYDYIFRWLAAKFLSKEEQRLIGNQTQPSMSNGEGPLLAADAKEPKAKTASRRSKVNQEDAPSCPKCGEIMTRSGACYRCLNCGEQHGCG